MEEQLQHQRFERKYFITERQALEIRALAKTFLVPDKFSEGKQIIPMPFTVSISIRRI
jgi:hypothetical protein